MGIDVANKNFYDRPDVVENSSQHHLWLWPEEQFILEEWESSVRNKAVLDIGCGSGRLTPALTKLTQDYVGIDYAKGMIEACKKKFDGTKFMHCDASDMTVFGDERFDFVFFTFNGMDCISHEKRLKALGEIHRILKSDGVFAFSTHNLDDRRHVTAYDIRSINILRNIRNVFSYLKVRKEEVHAETYAVLSDPLDGFGQLTYLIRKREQVLQLEHAGFSGVRIMDQNCQFTDAESLDRDTKWFWYICGKRG